LRVCANNQDRSRTRAFWRETSFVVSAALALQLPCFSQANSSVATPSASLTQSQSNAQQAVPDKIVAAPSATATTANPTSTDASTQAAAAIATGADAAGTKLDIGDLVSIKVYGAPELSDEERINNTGDLYLALIGTVHIKGLTPEEAQSLIEGKLKDGGFLRDPHVTLFVKEYATAGISIMGEVVKPGTYPLIGEHRLFDVISAAGGLSPRAGNDVTINHRADPQHPERLHLEGDLAHSASVNVAISPGDIIFISKAGVVYVVGDVHSPGGYVIEQNHGITAMQALAMAQGNNPTASLKHARVVRRDSSGVATEIPVDLEKIERAKAPDMALQSDDVLFIPTSAGKTAFHRTADSILNAAIGMAITHPYP